jgi:putative ABC transport system permease protein
MPPLACSGPTNQWVQSLFLALERIIFQGIDAKRPRPDREFTLQSSAIIPAQTNVIRGHKSLTAGGTSFCAREHPHVSATFPGTWKSLQLRVLENGGFLALDGQQSKEVPVDRLGMDVRVAIRSLAKQRSFTLVALVTLALGTGATTAIFSVVHGVLLKPLSYPEPQRIVSLWQTARDNPGPNVVGTTSHLNYLDWKREAESFESMALYSGANFILTGLGDAEIVHGGMITPDFFRVFKSTPVMGREFTPEEDLPNGPKVVIVSYSFWKDRLNGRSDVIGSTINLSAGPTEIIGVAPSHFDFPNHAQIWTPIQNDDKNCGRDCVYVDGIARLAPGVTVEQARSEMQAIAAQLEKEYPAANTNVTVGVLGLQDETVRDVRTALLFIFVSVAMVLLIACANVANLVLVRGTLRQSEMAVRAALGGGRSRLAGYLLTENLLLAISGGLAGVMLSWWGIDALKRVAPPGIPRLDEVHFDGVTFAFALGIAVLTMFVFGLGPAIRLSRTSLASLLNSRSNLAPVQSARSRSTLVAAEVALSLMLLVGAGLMFRTLTEMRSVRPGFNPANITEFTLALPPLRYPKSANVMRTFERLDEQFEAIPGVQRVGRISGLPLSGSENVQTFRRLDRTAPEPGQAANALYRIVDADYFRTLEIPIKAGRDFTPADRNEAPAVVIISEEMARQFWRDENPLGKMLQVDTGPPRTVVGIASNVRSQKLTLESQAEMYLPQTQTRAMTFVVRASIPSTQVLAAVRQIVKEVDPNMPVIRPGTLQGLVDLQMARTQFTLLLAALFAALAVTLASVGTYGVVAYAVVQRTREIGLRLALGASPPMLMARIIWEGFRPAAIGMIVGIAGALFTTRLIQALLFQIQPTDPTTFVEVTALLAGLTLMASLIPAQRAIRISPASTLRGE